MIWDNSKTLLRNSDSSWYCMTCQKKDERRDGYPEYAVKRIDGSECPNGKEHVTISKETVS